MAGTDISTSSSNDSHDSPLYTLGRPNRELLRFQIPNRQGIPVLAILGVKIPVYATETAHIVGYIFRTHTVEMNETTGELNRLRKGNAGHSYTPIIPAAHARKQNLRQVSPCDFEMNESSSHQALCRSKTLDRNFRGKCFCDIDKEFKPSEVLEAYEEALRVSQRKT